MNKYLQQVSEFHKLFKLPILEKPTIIDSKRFNMRMDLIDEENLELVEAHKQEDKVEVLDALADLQYVLSGAILELGYKDVFDEAFDRVHKSNMSKACSNAYEGLETVMYYKDTKGVDATAELQEDGSYLVFRKNDGKVLKSINYQAVDLTDLV